MVNYVFLTKTNTWILIYKNIWTNSQFYCKRDD